jgi:hypothetical protein
MPQALREKNVGSIGSSCRTIAVSAAPSLLPALLTLAQQFRHHFLDVPPRFAARDDLRETLSRFDFADQCAMRFP